MANPGTSDATHMLRKSTFEQVLREGKFTPPGEISRRDGIEKSACEEVANRLGDGRATIANWYRYVKGTKWEPDLSLWPGRAAIRAPEPQPAVGDELAEAVRKAADRPGGTSLEEIAQETGASIGEVLDAVDILKEQGIAIKRIGDRYEVSRSPLPAFAESQALIEIFSDENNRFRFGALGDNHAASKYERLDVLESLYGHFERAGISKVFHTGNWIDGEARFNRQDIVAFGLEGQARYLAKTYPKHTGITTYAIWGDDHEGWYTREGIDVGRYVEDVMHSEGRTDWRNLGFLEAHVKLVNSNTGASQIMAVVHPGGGSAYAISYKPQKIIECVPVNSEILTKSGWARHDQIAIGDAVLGYNIETDRCEWTVVTAIHRGRGEIVRYSNDQFDVRCTRNHRWAIEWESRAGPNPASRIPAPYSRRERHIWTIDEAKDRSRIIQSAPAPDGPGLPPFERTDWLRRELAVETVMKMTSGERRAFIEGMLLGEGTIANSNGYRSVIFSQNPGPVCDAFRLACFLEGIATTDKDSRPGSFKPDGIGCRKVTVLAKRMRICNRLRQKTEGEQDVWCVTTGLGTWVMRQNDAITITGNSMDGGEKPALVLLGHYHKLEIGNVRNVWYIQTGTTQDQTVFLRKKSIEAHVGGLVVDLEQDPETGAIIECNGMRRYFNRAYYTAGGHANQRWSKHGPIRPAPRSAGGV